MGVYLNINTRFLRINRICLQKKNMLSQQSCHSSEPPMCNTAGLMFSRPEVGCFWGEKNWDARRATRVERAEK